MERNLAVLYPDSMPDLPVTNRLLQKLANTTPQAVAETQQQVDPLVNIIKTMLMEQKFLYSLLEQKEQIIKSLYAKCLQNTDEANGKC